MDSNYDSPILVTGLPRSGTSMVAGILAEIGIFTGPTIAGGESNPKGFFENEAIREGIIKVILKSRDFCPLGVTSLPPKNFNEVFTFDNGKSVKEILQKIISARNTRERW